MSEEEIQELLKTLKFNIPTEYIRSCDTGDGIGRLEDDEYSWQYKLDIYINQLQQENQELKKQLENIQLIKSTCGFCPYYKTKEKMKNQQKEFIEYLEEEMKLWTEALNEEHDYELVKEFSFKCNTYEEILSKYKEIIGGKE